MKLKKTSIALLLSLITVSTLKFTFNSHLEEVYTKDYKKVILEEIKKEIYVKKNITVPKEILIEIASNSESSNIKVNSFTINKKEIYTPNKKRKYVIRDKNIRTIFKNKKYLLTVSKGQL